MNQQNINKLRMKLTSISKESAYKRIGGEKPIKIKLQHEFLVLFFLRTRFITNTFCKSDILNKNM